MRHTTPGRHRKPSSNRLPWWGHLIVLTLILTGTGASIATGIPLYALVLNPLGVAIGAAILRGVRVHAGRVVSAAICIALAGAVYLAALTLRGHGPDATDIGFALTTGPIILLITASIGGEVWRIQRPRHAAVAR